MMASRSHAAMPSGMAEVPRSSGIALKLGSTKADLNALSSPFANLSGGPLDDNPGAAQH